MKRKKDWASPEGQGAQRERYGCGSEGWEQGSQGGCKEEDQAGGYRGHMASSILN